MFWKLEITLPISVFVWKCYESIRSRTVNYLEESSSHSRGYGHAARPLFAAFSWSSMCFWRKTSSHAGISLSQYLLKSGLKNDLIKMICVSNSGWKYCRLFNSSRARDNWSIPFGLDEVWLSVFWQLEAGFKIRRFFQMVVFLYNWTKNGSRTSFLTSLLIFRHPRKINNIHKQKDSCSRAS